ncbi:TspO/MBR family protein [Marinibaculum pumilum]|uniref:TspO/MBR family protein n=1 Tax=Marinibaculum pumilum TaxID=1766165 RepID=A0ABV7KTU7_9PROT
MAALASFLLLVVGGGLVIGYVTAPGDWYATLAKPAFTPPDWVFAPAWTLLYILIAVAGWRIWRRRPGPADADADAGRQHLSLPAGLWAVQLALNFLWSPAFFAAHQVGLALAIVAALLACILAFIATAWRADRVAALLFLPYAAWTAYATALNAAILALN